MGLKDELKSKLDIDKNGKITIEDAVAYFGTNVRNAMLTGLGVGVLVGFVVGAGFAKIFL
jgi:hypothetical protein